MHTILLHGLGQSSSSFDKTIELLKIDTENHAPDIFEPTDDELNYENIYQAVTSYLDLFEEPRNLCGLSLGEF